jgi:K+-sensing histidine kinase KdpD
VGQTLAFSQRSRPDYAAGGASDLGWIVPFLCLAAFALHESAPLDAAEDAPPIAERLRPMGSAGWLLAVAAIVAVDALFGSSSGSPALDAARAHLTQAMVVAMALLLAGRELLAAREGQTAAAARFPREASPSRWARRMGSAVHELGSHLSSINALSRLLLSQSDPSTRARADTRRLHDRAEAATRVVRNLLAALPSSVGGRDRASPNRVVEDAVEARRAGLEADGIGVRCALAPRVPNLPIDGAALRHVVVALLDRAGVAVRGRPSPGQIEVTTAVRAGAVLVTVGDDGVSAPGPVLDRLMDALLDSSAPAVDSDLERSLVRESIEREGGSLAVGHRPGGGTEFVVRLPIPEALLRAAEGEEDPAARLKSGTS